MTEIILGTNFYRAIPYTGIFKYTVIGLRISEKVTNYEVVCNSCLDHTPCQLLVGKDDYGKFVYIQMLNNNDANEDQRFYHNIGEGHYFYLRQIDAEKERALRYLREAEKELKTAEEVLKNRQLNLIRMKDTVEALRVKEKSL